MSEAFTLTEAMDLLRDLRPMVNFAHATAPRRSMEEFGDAHRHFTAMVNRLPRMAQRKAGGE